MTLGEEKQPTYNFLALNKERKYTPQNAKGGKLKKIKQEVRKRIDKIKINKKKKWTGIQNITQQRQRSMTPAANNYVRRTHVDCVDCEAGKICQSSLKSQAALLWQYQQCISILTWHLQIGTKNNSNIRYVLVCPQSKIKCPATSITWHFVVNVTTTFVDLRVGLRAFIKSFICNESDPLIHLMVTA